MDQCHPQPEGLKWADSNPLFICLERDIPDGGYRPFSAFQFDMILRRQGERLYVSHNRCPHRGFRIAQKDGTGELHCPFHGQKFTFPNSEFSVFRRDGYLFFGRFDFDHPPATLPALGEEVYSWGTILKAPFFLWMQNTMDPNHLELAHKGGFAESFELPAVPEMVQFSEDQVFSSYELKLNDRTVCGYWNLLGDRSLPGLFKHGTIYPNVSITSFMDVFQTLEVVLPATAKTSTVHTRLFIDPKHKTKLEPVLDLASKSTERILREDKALVESWAKSDYAMGTHWMRGEERIQAYRELLLEDGFFA